MLLLQTIMNTALAMSKKNYGTQFEEIFFILNNGITYLFSLLSFKFSLIELEFFSLQNVAITSTTLSWAGCHFSCKTREKHFTDILSKSSYSSRPCDVFHQGNQNPVILLHLATSTTGHFKIHHLTINTIKVLQQLCLNLYYM